MLLLARFAVIGSLPAGGANSGSSEIAASGPSNVLATSVHCPAYGALTACPWVASNQATLYFGVMVLSSRSWCGTTMTRSLATT